MSTPYAPTESGGFGISVSLGRSYRERTALFLSRLRMLQIRKVELYERTRVARDILHSFKGPEKVPSGPILMGGLCHRIRIDIDRRRVSAGRDEQPCIGGH